jgi:hypothetical protein
MRLYTALFLFLVFPVSVGFATFTEHQFDGGHAQYPANWEMAENWNPDGVPTLCAAVTIASRNPYVAVTGSWCQAFSLNIQAGGRLVLRKDDNGRVLTVLTNMIIDAGGEFNTAGSAGEPGPLVIIGGNIVNHGTLDLRGVSAGHEQVILAGMCQTIRGSAFSVFQNLRSLAAFTVDGVDVYVLGTYTGPWPKEINGGRFIVGEAPLPITLAYFRAAFNPSANGVCINWRTLTEVDNYGFYIERRAPEQEVYESCSFVPSKGNGIVPHEYAFTDATVSSGNWYYRLRQVDLTGEETTTDPVLVDVRMLTAVGEGNAPAEFALKQNYPNPFNPETEIRFTVGASGAARLTVYDALGREVSTLFDGAADPGRLYSVQFGGRGLASGSYFYGLEADGRVEMKRMLLMK